MKKIRNLYDIVAKDAKSGKDAYEMVYYHIIDYASKLLTQKNIEDERLNEAICSSLFYDGFDDYGNLTEEEAYTYVSNIVENEIIIANYTKRSEEELFN